MEPVEGEPESEPEGEPEDTGAQNQPGHLPEGEATTVAGRLACGRAGGRGSTPARLQQLLVARPW